MFFSSLEVVVCLLVCALVGHLFHPSFTHVGLGAKLFEAYFFVFCMLDHESVLEAFTIHVGFAISASICIIVLILKLILKRVVLPFSLLAVISAHLGDNLLGFLRAEVWLVVLLVVVSVF